MASIPELYTREMHTKCEYLACWLPSTRMAVGDVGLLSGHRFRKLTTLAELGIPFTRNEDSPFTDLDYSSAECVAVEPGVRLGSTADDALCNLSVTFTRDGATLFQASGCVQESMGNIPALESALRTRHENRDWRLEYVVVTEVVRTGPTAILVAERRGAQLDLQVSTSALTSPLPIASATAKCAITRRQGIAADVLAPDGATPLFNAVQLRKRPLRAYDLVFRSDDDELSEAGDWDAPDEPDEPDETDLIRLTWADLGQDGTAAPSDV
ncbi:hypothetical protein E6R18_01160 [Streptomyces sp. A1277]|uniref:hypothetical protein n=1 Tax=Streptomyces sp. A1277 TaxID=2563103 RepID=UPI0010A29EDB|nr:hypothetical protein [Streptomyces sp. A1277]THA36632.1 hypothetical protein E6R18_01160 [Streptomyces sp. A1277]